MNYYLYCLRRFARLILLLWIVFRIAPLAAQDRAARLDFQVRKATLDTFVRQLEDSTGFSFIYGEKVQLRQLLPLMSVRRPSRKSCNMHLVRKR